MPVLSQDDIRKGLHPTDEELKAFLPAQTRPSYNNSHPGKKAEDRVTCSWRKAKLLAQIEVHAGRCQGPIIQPAPGPISGARRSEGQPHPDQDSPLGRSGLARLTKRGVEESAQESRKTLLKAVEGGGEV